MNMIFPGRRLPPSSISCATLASDRQTEHLAGMWLHRNLAVEHHRRQSSGAELGARNNSVRSWPLRPISLSSPPAMIANSRCPSCLTSCSQASPSGGSAQDDTIWSGTRRGISAGAAAGGRRSEAGMDARRAGTRFRGCGRGIRRACFVAGITVRSGTERTVNCAGAWCMWRGRRAARAGT